MNEIDNKLGILYHIEKSIESYYIQLAKLEINGEKDSLEYNEYLKLILEGTKKEIEFFTSLDSKTKTEIQKRIKKENFNIKTDKPIALGFISNAYCFRIANMLDLQAGDDAFTYADALRYDINQILFSFLDFIIGNDYYEEIRKDLIFYKYNQIFLNAQSEYDLLICKDINTINLEINSYRTDDLPSYHLIDKAVLGLESLDFIAFIANGEDSFKENENIYTLIIVSIINIFARLVLCDEETMNLVFSNLDALQKDDKISDDIKNTIGEMFDILDTIKHKISWTR